MNIFEKSKNILFAGIGGGFDIFGALPFFHNLKNTHKIIFSNYNASCENFFEKPETYPDKELANILSSYPFYVLPKCGVKSQLLMYERIIENHEIDTIVAIDSQITTCPLWK